MHRFIYILGVLIFSINLQAAVLIDSGIEDTEASYPEAEESYYPEPALTGSLDDFSESSPVREKRFGLGIKFAGEVGAAGFHGEARIIDNIAVGASYGFGTGYQSLGMRLVQYFQEESWSLYALGGFTKWFSGSSSKENLEKSNPKFLADKFLNSEERRTGQFSEFLIYPGVGAQYNVGHGELVGLGLQAELILLMDVDDLNAAISGSLGAIYFF